MSISDAKSTTQRRYKSPIRQQNQIDRNRNRNRKQMLGSCFSNNSAERTQQMCLMENQFGLKHKNLMFGAKKSQNFGQPPSQLHTGATHGLDLGSDLSLNPNAASVFTNK